MNNDIGLRGLPLLKYILDNVENGTLNHRQNKWAFAPADEHGQPDRCNTAHCVAGWAAVLTGATVLFERSQVDLNFYANDCYTTPQSNNGRDGFWEKSISQRAREVLQLSAVDADVLFWWNNSFEDLRMFEKLLNDGVSLKDYVTD